MALANQEAQRFNHEYIGTEHILLGLVKEGSGVGANVLKNLDVDLRKVRLEVEKLVKSGPDMVTMGKLPQTPRAKKGDRIRHRRGPQPQSQLCRHRAPAARPAPRAGRRGGPGADEPGLKLDEVRDEVLNLLGAGTESEDVPGGGGAPAGEAQGGKRGSTTRARLVRPRSDRVGPPASSTRSSGGRAKSNAWCRFSAAAEEQPGAARRSRRWERPQSSKGWPAASSRGTSPSCSPIAASSCSTWP
jgi:ATP-dependent Clp protease ATP-binding subunit ClpC